MEDTSLYADSPKRKRLPLVRLNDENANSVDGVEVGAGELEALRRYREPTRVQIAGVELKP